MTLGQEQNFYTIKYIFANIIINLQVHGMKIRNIRKYFKKNNHKLRVCMIVLELVEEKIVLSFM